MNRHRPCLAICIKKLQKRKNVKIFVKEQVHIGHNNKKVNSDFEIGCKKCKKVLSKRITQEKYLHGRKPCKK